MSPTPTPLLRAATVAIAPLVLLGGFLGHPYIPGKLPNDEAIAAAVAAAPTQWGLAHVATAVASALMILAFLAVRSYLREAGEQTWSVLGLPLIVIGSTLYAVLPGMEFAPLAAIEAGADAQQAQSALSPWFLPVLMTGALTFALGSVAFAKAVADAEVLGPRLTWLVAAALVITAVSRFVPLAAVQFYVQGAAALVALLPLALAMAKQPQSRLAGQSQPLAVTVTGGE